MPSTMPLSLRSAAIAHALSHPVRVEILTMLNEEKKLTVSEITRKLARPQANISQHLAVLREVYLVEATRDGMSVEYNLSKHTVQELITLLAKLAADIPAEEFTPRGRGRRRGGGRGLGHRGHRLR